METFNFIHISEAYWFYHNSNQGTIFKWNHFIRPRVLSLLPAMTGVKQYVLKYEIVK